MAFEDYKTKDSVVVVFTGDGKGKTSAAVGLAARALGNGWRGAFIQFIKTWPVSEHDFFARIKPVFKSKFMFYKGGRGFYSAGELSQPDVTPAQHEVAAQATYKKALAAASSGKYDLLICDEINNAVYHRLISQPQLKALITKRSPKTSLCLTGREFPEELIKLADIATNMTKVRHHYDQKFLANKGIDF